MITCLEKGRLFLICTKAPYGLAVVLEINLGRGQAQSLREPPTLGGEVGEEEPTKETLSSG